MTRATDAMRIGEFSARVGLSTHTIRAWERRYGLVSPLRTEGGYRVYGPGDLARVRAAASLVESGVSAANSAARVLAAERANGGPKANSASRPARDVGASLLAAVLDFDEAAVHASLDRLFADRPIEEAIETQLLPFLRQLGGLWAAGEASVAHEHFASALIRRRLSAHTMTWGRGQGPVVILACLPGEQHDLALLCLGVLLGRSGWRVRFLGSGTPIRDVSVMADRVTPDWIVLSGRDPESVTTNRRALSDLSRRHRVGIAGPAAAPGRMPGRVHRHTGSVADTARALTARA